MEKIEIKNHYYKYWTDLIKPKDLEVDQVSITDTYGKFYIRPLERGYGLTLGNAIRRVLLSSMMGSAVSAVKFEGIVHEFTSLPDVLEDTTDIILNLKKVRFKQDNADECFLKIEKKGPGLVLASDIQTTNTMEVLNPDQIIATLGEKASFCAEILVTFDRGYVQEVEKKRNLPVGFVGMDAIHSPIRRVNYMVNSARIGQRTDYESLVIEVWTDGSLKAVEALPLGYKILKEQLQVFINFNEDIEPVKEEESEKEHQFNENLFRPVEDLELSVRSANCLKNARIRYIGDLVTKSEQTMLKTKNFGRKSLNEIKDILKPMGFGLGMTIEGWPPKNLSELISSKQDSHKKEEMASISSNLEKPVDLDSSFKEKEEGEDSLGEKAEAINIEPTESASESTESSEGQSTSAEQPREDQFSARQPSAEQPKEDQSSAEQSSAEPLKSSEEPSNEEPLKSSEGPSNEEQPKSSEGQSNEEQPKSSEGQSSEEQPKSSEGQPSEDLDIETETQDDEKN